MRAHDPVYLHRLPHGELKEKGDLDVALEDGADDAIQRSLHLCREYQAWNIFEVMIF